MSGGGREATSLAVLQSLGERVRQARGADRGRRPGDVVVTALVAGGLRAQVEQQPGCARVAVARLADAAGVQQPLAAAKLEQALGAAGLAGRRLALESLERQRDVGMAEQVDPVARGVEAQ